MLRSFCLAAARDCRIQRNPVLEVGNHGRYIYIHIYSYTSERSVMFNRQGGGALEHFQVEARKRIGRQGTWRPTKVVSFPFCDIDRSNELQKIERLGLWLESLR